MFKYAMLALTAMLMASAAQAAEFKLGSITFDEDGDDTYKIFVRPVKCLTAVRLDVPISSAAIRLEKVRISYVVDGWGVDREKVLGRDFLRAGESTGWIPVPQKNTCVTAVLVDGEGTWNAGRDSKVIVYGAM